MGTAYSLSIVTVRQVATYPLTNVEHRKIVFYSNSSEKAWTSTEMMFNSGGAITFPTVDILNRVIRLPKHKASLVIGGITWGYDPSTYDKGLKVKNFKSNGFTIPSSGTTNPASVVHIPRLLTLGYGAVVTQLSGGQTLPTSSITLKNNIWFNNYKSNDISLPGTSLTLEYFSKVRSVVKIIDDKIYTSAFIEQRTGVFFLNYGGDNTYYSLNGFFNFFRYKYPAIMPTTYHILIGQKLINMYNSNMVCIESHRAGYKRVAVSDSFLKDESGFWLDKNTLPFVLYENKLVFYPRVEKKLYTYDFDNISFTNKTYYNLDASTVPSKVDLFLDPSYNMPYIMPYSEEGGQLITASEELWNFIQINNVKLVSTEESLITARDNYINEIYTPTMLYVDKILFRYKDTFIIQSHRGAVEHSIHSTNAEAMSTIDTIVTYNGSKIIYSEYPVIYYSEYNEGFQSSSIFSKLVKLNIETMIFETIKLEHYVYMMYKESCMWHLYKAVSNNCYYIFRDDAPDNKVNLTMTLGFIDEDIIEFMIFNTFDVYLLTSTRKVIYLNTLTMEHKQLTLVGTPILMLKFTPLIGCVLTRKDTSMYFEELQPVLWSRNPIDWVTPYDMRKGERLLPYSLVTGLLHSRTAPIISQYNLNIVERISNKYIAAEVGVVDQMVVRQSESVIYPVKVGSCTQKVYGHLQMSDINPQVYSYGQAQYSKSIEVEAVLNPNDTFTLKVKDLPIPEALQAGFKIYEK